MKFLHIQQFFFFGLLLVTTGVFLSVLGSYLFPVLWGVVLAVVFYPLYIKIRNRFGHRDTLAALVTMLTIIVCILIPLIIIGSMIVQDSVELYQRITQEEDLQHSSLLLHVQNFTAYLEPLGVSQETVIERAQEWIATLSQAISSSLIALSQVTFSLFVHTAIMIYLLFFFFRDGEKLMQTLMYYLPLDNTHERRLFTRFTETSRAVVKGTLTIALLQGLLIGLTFWITGVGSPVLLAVVVAILAIIPAIGPALVWVPAGIIMIAAGSLWQGIVIIVVGVLLVSLIDEFLRPILVGRKSKMPDAIVLLATIGGLATFGISGFVIGPIIAAFFLALWGIFGEQYSLELKAKSTVQSE